MTGAQDIWGYNKIIRRDLNPPSNLPNLATYLYATNLSAWLDGRATYDLIQYPLTIC